MVQPKHTSEIVDSRRPVVWFCPAGDYVRAWVAEISKSTQMIDRPDPFRLRNGCSPFKFACFPPRVLGVLVLRLFQSIASGEFPIDILCSAGGSLLLVRPLLEVLIHVTNSHICSLLSSTFNT